MADRLVGADLGGLFGIEMATPTLQQRSVDLAGFIAGLEDFAAMIVPAVANLEAIVMERVMSDVVAATPDAVVGTPYRTGYAKANWMPSIGQPSTDLLPPFVDSALLVGAGIGQAAPGSTIHPVHGTQAHQEHGMSREQAELTSLQRIPGIAAAIRQSRTTAPDVFITNNVPYIQDLEHGSSIQAPEGFARLAVSAVQVFGASRKS